jgi:hypothetical protein
MIDTLRLLTTGEIEQLEKINFAQGITQLARVFALTIILCSEQ